MHHFVGTLHTC